jgi:hypothetical protein
MNKLVKETRLISATKEEWDQIKKILGNRIPENQFDPNLYVNSRDALARLKASSFKKQLYDSSIQFFLRLSHEMGLDFMIKNDEPDIIDIKFNETLNEGNNYDVFIHHIKMNTIKKIFIKNNIDVVEEV